MSPRYNWHFQVLLTDGEDGDSRKGDKRYTELLALLRSPGFARLRITLVVIGVSHYPRLNLQMRLGLGVLPLKLEVRLALTPTRSAQHHDSNLNDRVEPADTGSALHGEGKTNGGRNRSGAGFRSAEDGEHEGSTTGGC